jgi:hypothetical protein
MISWAIPVFASIFAQRLVVGAYLSVWCVLLANDPFELTS